MTYLTGIKAYSTATGSLPPHFSRDTISGHRDGQSETNMYMFVCANMKY